VAGYTGCVQCRSGCDCSTVGRKYQGWRGGGGFEAGGEQLHSVLHVLLAGNMTVRFTSGDIYQRDDSSLSDSDSQTEDYSYTGFTAVLEGSLCPGGTFSATGRLENGSCPGVCSAGYACPVGSINGTTEACPGDTFGVRGQAQCPSVVHYLESRCKCCVGCVPADYTFAAVQ
jgi:hypothetical protein